MIRPNEPNYTRMMLAVALAGLLLIVWQAQVEYPRRKLIAEVTQAEAEKAAKARAREAQIEAAKTEPVPQTHAARLAASPRIKIASDKLHGSIALKGARFDDLQLALYRMELDETSPEVTIFAPQGDEDAYFAQVGWVSPDGSTQVPNDSSLWKADQKELVAGSSVNLRWDNGQGVTFIISIALDQDYMFSVGQRVENHSKAAINVAPYAYINRSYHEPAQHFNIMHEGPMGVLEGALKELSYQELREKGTHSYDNASGWLGITDKYWLSALIPAEASYHTNFTYYQKSGQDRYQVDYLGSTAQIEAGGNAASALRLFAGAKEIEVLDRYTVGDGKEAPVPLFDRAVDFGVLYLLTKPLFLLLNYFYSYIGNFGLAIMMLTIVVKLAMFPLANKAFKATTQMRDLQPEMQKLKERCGEDKQKFNQELIQLYKREKVNPASGCLPILIQMPVFFALYKVFFVTIEMRHAPFFGWIRDLSAPDSSNLFTLFGLLPWDAPGFLHLGVLPILMCATMVIQMKQQPKPTDPTQAKMMAIMPYFFLFMFTGFPAGLVLYWIWSNILSILQQIVISWRYHKYHPVGQQKKASKIAEKKAKKASAEA